MTFRKTFFPVYVLLCVFLSATAFFTPRDPVQHTLDSIVAVQSWDYETDVPRSCTGVMVAPHRALTAAHCLKDDAGFTVDGEDAIVMASSESLLLVSAGDKKPLKVARSLKLFEPVITFGFAWGEMVVFGRHVARIHGEDFITDGPLAPGMSGGPVVNAAGELVGINQATNDVIGVICGPEEIRAFLSLPLQR